MKKVILNIVVAVVSFVALALVIGFAIGMVLWVIIGDTHVEIWKASKYVTLTVAAVISATCFWFDMRNVAARVNRRIRFFSASLVCLLIIGFKIYAEVRKFKGWEPESAALSIATSLYPEYAGTIDLKIKSKEDISGFGRGPYIVYNVAHHQDILCRIGVARNWWLYWTCGMYERLKERNAQQGGGYVR